MNPGDLIGFAVQFGIAAPLVVYIIWDKNRINQKWRDHEERRLKVDEARVETDKEMILTLQALTFHITGRAKP